MVISWVDSQKEAFLPLGSDSDCVKVFQGVGYCAASAPYCISSALLSCDIETSSSSAPKPCDFIRDFIEMSGRSQRKCCVFWGQSPVKSQRLYHPKLEQIVFCLGTNGTNQQFELLKYDLIQLLKDIEDSELLGFQCWINPHCWLKTWGFGFILQKACTYILCCLKCWHALLLSSSSDTPFHSIQAWLSQVIWSTGWSSQTSCLTECP